MADGGWQGFIHMGVLTLMAGNVFAAIVGLLMIIAPTRPGLGYQIGGYRRGLQQTRLTKCETSIARSSVVLSWLALSYWRGQHSFSSKAYSSCVESALMKVAACYRRSLAVVRLHPGHGRCCG